MGVSCHTIASKRAAISADATFETSRCVNLLRIDGHL
jgi:hypothetical protein